MIAVDVVAAGGVDAAVVLREAIESGDPAASAGCVAVAAFGDGDRVAQTVGDFAQADAAGAAAAAADFDQNAVIEADSLERGIRKDAAEDAAVVGLAGKFLEGAGTAEDAEGGVCKFLISRSIPRLGAIEAAGEGGLLELWQDFDAPGIFRPAGVAAAGRIGLLDGRKLVEREGLILEVTGALGAAGRFAAGLDSDQEESNEDAHDGEDDEEFDESEAGWCGLLGGVAAMGKWECHP